MSNSIEPGKNMPATAATESSPPELRCVPPLHQGVKHTQQAFIAERVRQIQREVLAAVSRSLPFYKGGPVLPSTIESFGELHDYCDANALGGLCDDDIVVAGNALFPERTDPDTTATQQWMEACNVIQSKVNAWIVAGEMKAAAELLATFNDEQLAGFFDDSRSGAAHLMLHYLRHRAGSLSEPSAQALSGLLIPLE